MGAAGVRRRANELARLLWRVMSNVGFIFLPGETFVPSSLDSIVFAQVSTALRGKMDGAFRGVRLFCL
jgi:hypothetical protein